MHSFHSNIAKLPRKYKILLMLICDVILLPFALWSAVALRYGVFDPEIATFWWLFILLPIFTVPIFIRVGLYRAVIRYLDEQIIKTVIFGVTLSVFVLVTIALMTKVIGLPRSSIIIYWVIAVSYIAASRYLARGILRNLERKKRRKQPVAIYGAGRAGLQTALALVSGAEYDPVLFFDDQKDLQGTTVVGIRVYNPQEAEQIMEQYDCFEILLALPSASRARRREIIQRFEGKKIQLKTIPGMHEILGGGVRIDEIREVGIEDLLGRDPVPPFEDLMANNIENKVVVVTGAGGSIGSELCRQILKYRPKKIILFERHEFLLYKIEQELVISHKDQTIIPILGDILNQEQFEKLLSLQKVETIYHTAAYKHVPLVESNIVSGVLNNVFGTLSAAKAAINQEVKTFVLISTDKAVRPTNIMGATKRLAELILQALSASQKATRFCMVRFGNVLGSSGSVVPLFREQIKAGGPVTVTHAEVTRYFMTIPEAAQLVLQAGAMSGVGGEVFVLDMGEPIKISDLAAKMIVLSGFEVKNLKTGEGDIAIEYVGLRPGEKLYEELLIGGNAAETRHPRIMKASENYLELPILMGHLERIKLHCLEGKSELVVDEIKQVVKEYQPSPNCS